MKKLLFALIISLSFILPVYAGVDFDGIDDYITVAETGIPSGATGEFLTVSFWVKVNSLRSGNNNYDNLITIEDEWIIRFEESGHIWIRTYGGNNGGTTDVISTGTWYHILVTWDVGTGHEVYVNGSSWAQAGAANTDTSADAGNPLTICKAISYDYPTDGTITEVAVWDVALTQTEIDLLAKSRLKRIPLQTQPSHLKLYLPMDDLSEGGNLAGATFMDMSGNGNDGTGSDADASGGQGKAEEVLSYPVGVR